MSDPSPERPPAFMRRHMAGTVSDDPDALVALACDEIIMTPVGKLGDCAPISMAGTLEGLRREKTESPLRAEFRESAEMNGYPIVLSESMASWDMEVWLIRDKSTRQLRYVERA